MVIQDALAPLFYNIVTWMRTLLIFLIVFKFFTIFGGLAKSTFNGLSGLGGNSDGSSGSGRNTEDGGPPRVRLHKPNGISRISLCTSSIDQASQTGRIRVNINTTQEEIDRDRIDNFEIMSMHLVRRTGSIGSKLKDGFHFTRPKFYANNSGAFEIDKDFPIDAEIGIQVRAHNTKGWGKRSSVAHIKINQASACTIQTTPTIEITQPNDNDSFDIDATNPASVIIQSRINDPDNIISGNINHSLHINGGLIATYSDNNKHSTFNLVAGSLALLEGTHVIQTFAEYNGNITIPSDEITIEITNTNSFTITSITTDPSTGELIINYS